MPHRLLLLTALLASLTACSEIRDTAGRAGDCAGIVRDVASTNLGRTPTAQDAEAAARRLDDRVASLDDEQLRTAVASLRDRLRELTEAARRSDADAVRSAGESVRAAAAETASLCGLPADRLLGAAGR